MDGTSGSRVIGCPVIGETLGGGRGQRPARVALGLIAALLLASGAGADTLIGATFDAGAEGFAYGDDAFRGTTAPAYADGVWDAAGGENGGGLLITIGNVDDADVLGMSGGFTTTLTLPLDTANVRLAFRYRLAQQPNYESDERSQVLASFDGALLPGLGPDWIDQVIGDGNGGPPIVSGWTGADVDLGTVAAGVHTLTIGGWNDKKTLNDEWTTVQIDDVRVTGDPIAPCVDDAECDDGNACTDDVCDAGTCVATPNTDPCDDGLSCTGGDVCSGGICGGSNLCPGARICIRASDSCELAAAQGLVDGLSLETFKDHIETLSSTTGPTGGSRYWSQPGNAAALDYLEAELASYGYVVERHAYSYSGQTRENVYATKVGATRPDEMIIVSAHMDSINFDSPDRSFAPGANDDASGTALVLEAARVFSDPAVTIEPSVRFILWNNEETGLNGSEAYVADRRALQGVESPPGSGLYPEPTWIGVIQHDMMLWDHGLPPGPDQIPGADNDIEYQASSAFAAESLALANLVHQANVDYAPAYPSEVTNDMCCTDSVPFQDDVAAISVRENRRRAEIGNGSNPNWHRDSDVFATYSEADFALGFNALQATVGAVAEIALARRAFTCGDGVLDPEEECDDGNTAPGDCCSAFCTIEPGGTVCRAGADVCDVAESCDGATPVCPADAVRVFGTSCRVEAGVCDLPEFCDGVGKACPADAKATGECRPAADVCDVAESCDGVGDACPPDAFAPPSTVCRDAVGACDVAESCDGLAAACPPDAGLDGDPCEDGSVCTSADVCVAGSCVGGGPLDCDDGDPCTADACDASNGCTHDPIAGCEPPVPVPTHRGPFGWGLVALVLVGAGVAWLRESRTARVSA